MNRDYFSKPIQSGSRDSHDYGRTFLGPAQPPRDPWMKPALVFTLLVVLYFGWQFTR